MLSKIEREFLALRRSPPDVTRAMLAAMEQASGLGPAAQDERLRAAGEAVASSVEQAAKHGELAYHNRHHIVESLLAMGLLCGAARHQGAITAFNAQLGIVAMVGHDLLHDGSPPGGGLLEKRSADAVKRATEGLGLASRDHAVIRATIKGTNPDLITRNAARAAGAWPAGRLGRAIDVIIAMANEADVFASLLPKLGPQLTQALIQERRESGFPDAAGLAGPDKRRAFLNTYSRLTPAATELGLATLRDRQLSEIPARTGG